MGPHVRVSDGTRLRPQSAQRHAQETAAGLVEEAAPADAATRVKVFSIHTHLAHVNEFVQVEQQPGEAVQAGRVSAQVTQRALLLRR